MGKGMCAVGLVDTDVEVGFRESDGTLLFGKLSAVSETHWTVRLPDGTRRHGAFATQPLLMKFDPDESSFHSFQNREVGSGDWLWFGIKGGPLAGEVLFDCGHDLDAKLKLPSGAILTSNEDPRSMYGVLTPHPERPFGELQPLDPGLLREGLAVSPQKPLTNGSVVLIRFLDGSGSFLGATMLSRPEVPNPQGGSGPMYEDRLMLSTYDGFMFEHLTLDMVQTLVLLRTPLQPLLSEAGEPQRLFVAVWKAGVGEKPLGENGVDYESLMYGEIVGTDEVQGTVTLKVDGRPPDQSEVTVNAGEYEFFVLVDYTGKIEPVI